MLPSIRRRRPDSRVTKTLALNGNRASVLLLARSGMSLDEAIEKSAQIHNEVVTPVDDYFDRLQKQFDAARGIEPEPVRKSLPLPEPDALATISFIVEEF
jgi:hypothetical protein